MKYNIVNLFSIPNIIVKVPTIWLLKNSMIDSNILYNAHLIVRYNTIVSYLEGDNSYWDIYNQMQRKRVAQKSIIPREKANNELAFKELIKNMIINGYNDKFPIEVNEKFRLIDGSHRLAIALYLKIPYVPVTISKRNHKLDPEYSLEWFNNNGFTNIIDEIKNTYDRIIGEIDYE